MHDDRGAIRKGRWAVAAMFAVNGMIMGAFAPQIPLLLPRHAITETVLGLLILLLGIGAVGAMLFSGRLIAAFGSRRVVIAFAVLAVPVLPLVVLAPGLGSVAGAMMLFGAVLGCMDVAMNANAVAVERRLGQAILSSSHGFWSVGGFVGGALGGLLLARVGAETQALVAAGLAAAVGLAAARFLIEDTAPAPQTVLVPRQALIPRAPILWVLGGMALCTMMSEGAVLDWAALYLTDELGADRARSGLAFGLFSGTMAVMRFAGDGLRNRFGAVATLRVSGVIGAAGMMAAALAPTDLTAIAGFAVAGIGVANMVPIIFSAAGNQPGLSPGAGIATVTMLGYCGILIAPSSIGFAAEAVGFRPTYGILALLLLGVAAMAGRVTSADRVGEGLATRSPAA